MSMMDIEAFFSHIKDAENGGRELMSILVKDYGVTKDGEQVKQYILENDTIRQENTTEKSGATKGKLLPTPSGELVSDFLVANFQNIVDYDFTAGVENQLDLIAQHKLGRVEMLRAFYGPFQEEVRAAEDSERFNGARELGIDPKSGRPIFAKIGRHGGYLQVGVNSGKSTSGRASASNKGTDGKAGTSGKNASGRSASHDKPDFYSLPAGTTVKTVTLEQALQQMALPQLPRTLGTLDDGTPLIVAAGPFGPYVKGGLYSAPLKVTGAKILAFERRAKYILIHLDNGICLIWHLGMSGQIKISDKKLPKEKHDHVVMQTDNGFITYHDARRFGMFTYFDEKNGAKPKFLQELGPEPFDERIGS